MMGFIRRLAKRPPAHKTHAPAAPPAPFTRDASSLDFVDPSSPDRVERWLADQGEAPVHAGAAARDAADNSDVDAFLGDELLERPPLAKESASEALLASECVSRLIH